VLTFEQFAQQLLAARSILIATHQAPDGDGIGCQLALRRQLASDERKVTVVTVGEIPPRYRFLPGAHDAVEWLLITEEDRSALIEEHELILVVDAHQLAMLGELGDQLGMAPREVLYLDHHPIKGNPPEQILCDHESSSTGEVCWHVIKALGLPISAETATCLYLAIAYDTNFFKYLRRRPETHRVAADLIALGADSDKVYRHAFASKTTAQVALTGALLQSYQLEEGGLIAWASIDAALIEQTQAKPDELRDALTQLLEISGVEIAIIFKERANGRQKVSLRSKGRYAVSRVAAKLGGGGHPFASGAHVDGPVSRCTEEVLALVRDLIRGGDAVAPES